MAAKRVSQSQPLSRDISGGSVLAAAPSQSKSRNVNAFVKAVLKHRKLVERQAKVQIALVAVTRKTTIAANQVKVRRDRMKGFQLAEAARILGGRHP